MGSRTFCSSLARSAPVNLWRSPETLNFAVRSVTCMLAAICLFLRFWKIARIVM